MKVFISAISFSPIFIMTQKTAGPRSLMPVLMGVATPAQCPWRAFRVFDHRTSQ